MISMEDIIAMAETEEQKKFFGIVNQEAEKAGEQPVKLIEQEYDGMEIVCLK